MTELRFDGRVAIITGGGRGMGRAHALTLAARGARVVVNDLGTSLTGEGTNMSPAHEVVEEIRAAGGAALANMDTVSTTEGAEGMVAAALENFGRIDIVVNNAGIVTHGSFVEIDLDDFMKHLSVHPIGSFNVSRAAWPHMLAQNYGRIVIVTSSGFLGKRDVISYSAAKAGQIGLTKCLALDGAEHDIKVNAIAPVAYTRMTSDSNTPASSTTKPVGPENASAAVAVLLHESCPVSGELFGVGAGHIGRLFIAATLGYTSAHVLTPEEALGHWEQVMDETGYYVPPDCIYHADRLRAPHLLKRRVATS